MYDLKFECNGEFVKSFGTMDEAVDLSRKLHEVGIKTHPIVFRETPVVRLW